MKNDKDFFNFLVESTELKERIDNIIVNSKDYKKMNIIRSKTSDKYEKLDLTKEQREVTETYINCICEMSALSLELQYKQGYYDCIEFLKSIGII